MPIAAGTRASSSTRGTPEDAAVPITVVVGWAPEPQNEVNGARRRE
jgi:hypothetical protein